MGKPSCIPEYILSIKLPNKTCPTHNVLSSQFLKYLSDIHEISKGNSFFKKVNRS